MTDASTTRLSSRGQVVIPEAIRRALGLEAGERFVVVGEDDTVVLKRISPPSLADFDALLAEARKRASEVGLQQNDIEEAIRRARGRA